MLEIWHTSFLADQRPDFLKGPASEGMREKVARYTEDTGRNPPRPARQEGTMSELSAVKDQLHEILSRIDTRYIPPMPARG